MKKTLFIFLLQICLVSYAQLDKIQIDNVLRDSIESIHLKNTSLPLFGDSTLMEWEYPIAFFKDKHIYKVLYYQTRNKTIITDNVRLYSVKCSQNLILSGDTYMLIQIKALEDVPMCDGFVCCVVNNAQFFIDTTSLQDFSTYLTMSKSKIKIRKNSDHDYNWTFDGFERCYYYLITASKEVFSYLKDWNFYGEEDGDDYFTKVNFEQSQ